MQNEERRMQQTCINMTSRYPWGRGKIGEDVLNTKKVFFGGGSLRSFRYLRFQYIVVLSTIIHQFTSK